MKDTTERWHEKEGAAKLEKILEVFEALLDMRKGEQEISSEPDRICSATQLGLPPKESRTIVVRQCACLKERLEIIVGSTGSAGSGSVHTQRSKDMAKRILENLFGL